MGLSSGTWTVFPVSAESQAPGETPDLAVAPDGTLYALPNWIDYPQEVHVFDGATWDKLPDPPLCGRTARIDIDNHGLLWLAGCAGLASWDGEEWAPVVSAYDLSADGISALLVTEEAIWLSGYSIEPASVWLASWDGAVLSRFDMPDQVEDGFVAGVLEISEHPSGTHWLATQAGVVVFDGQGFTATEPNGGFNNAILSIAAGPDGSVWVAHMDGFWRYDGREWWSLYRDDDVPIACAEAVAAAHDGSIWVGTCHSGAARYDGDAWTFYTSDDGLLANHIHSLEVGRDGTIWFVHEDLGLTRYQALSANH